MSGSSSPSLFDAEGRPSPWLRAVIFLLVLWLVRPVGGWTWLLIKAPTFPYEWVEGGLVLFVSWVFLRLENQRLATLGLCLNRRWAMQFGLGTALGIGLIASAALVAWGTGACRFQWAPVGALGRLLSGAWLYLAVALNEELIFRGYGLQRAVAGLGRWAGQILFALLFTYAHWGNPGMAGTTRVWATLNIFLAGLFFGLVWQRTASLAMPIGLHFGWNWMQGSVLGFGVSGGASEGLLKPSFQGRPEWLSGGDFGLEAGLPCLLLCLASIVMTLRWQPEHPHQGDLP